jgi:hypothetical protein
MQVKARRLCWLLEFGQIIVRCDTWRRQVGCKGKVNGAPDSRRALISFTLSPVSSRLRPNFTPRSLALAIPSIWRSRRMSFSNPAIRARIHDQLS